MLIKLVLFAISSCIVSASTQEYDVCVYTGNAAGVMAAVAAAQAGMSVALVEPSRWLGGMVGGGIYNNEHDIDWGERSTIGGLTYMILSKGYDNPGYRKKFLEMIEEQKNIDTFYNYRVASVDTYDQDGSSAISSIALEFAPFDNFGCPPAKASKISTTARVISAKVFIDASYDGQLMASTDGVSYTYGRESSKKYGESLAGAQTPLAVYKIDPYNTPGDKSSGILPLLQSNDVINRKGYADQLTMGYGFRWTFSFNGDGYEIEPSDEYDSKNFELFRRAFQNDVDILAAADFNRGLERKKEVKGDPSYAIYHSNLIRSLESPTNYGSNMNFPDGSYSEKASIWKSQQNFVRDFTYFLQTDDSVPVAQQAIAKKVRLSKGQFDDTQGYPHQMYIREARRLISSYVLTQKDLYGNIKQPDPVALGSYGVDEFPYATVPEDGGVAVYGGYYSCLALSEDTVYQIPYRSIVPKQSECSNLIVPVALSASHIAYTSVRMEPVFMTLGQVAGIAASIAVKEGIAVQDVPYSQLRAALKSARIKISK